MARLEFAGARYVRNYHLAVPHHELEIDKSKSYPLPAGRGKGEGASLEDNLIIHGDNLKALKSLLPHFAGKVKCIYIDPPYNTGNEKWVYNDNVNSPRHKDWLNKVVDKDCQDRHDRWLSMMMPRLKLLRELLRDDGAIFVSIDDNEEPRIHLLMDEIFGEQNFVEQFIWKKSYGGGAKEKFVVRQHEYCLMFAKDKKLLHDLWLPPDLGAEKRYYKYKDDKFDIRGPYRIKPLEATKSMDERANLVYPIKAPDGSKIMPKRQWWWSRERTEAAIKNDELVFTKNNEGYSVSYKQYLIDEEGEKRGKKPFSVLDGPYTQEGSEEQLGIFGKQVLQFPKPSSLIKQFISIATSIDSDDLILDSFAGSGTTAHAVLALNKEDGGNRKFILVEQEDYADTITAERVRRVIKGVKDAKDENLKKGLGGSFTYVTLGAEYDVAKILSGKSLPKYEEMAAYIFQTATGETLDRKKIDKKSKYVGSSKFYDVYLFYEPDVEKLKSSECALKLDFVDALPKNPKKKRLVFGAVRYVNQETLSLHDVEFSQLPYEVYRRIEDAA
ncbi:MAG TPA: site-specific DNA-methyltransferase [Candidatus Kapabacteria bacterium]|jgi:adenine-specific DNA-methyltransferase|nr:site-specific DNA-methyltransferase [Candidatus Kapabacteria bacterium]